MIGNEACETIYHGRVTGCPGLVRSIDRVAAGEAVKGGGRGDRGEATVHDG